jgi:hypothetical protein
VLVTVAALVLLHGSVTVGPTTPVCRVGIPCSKPASGIVLTFRRPGRIVNVKTDTRGRYQVRLAAGSWRVQASIGMRLLPVVILVPRAAKAHRDFAIDTGIR